MHRRLAMYITWICSGAHRLFDHSTSPSVALFYSLNISLMKTCCVLLSFALAVMLQLFLFNMFDFFPSLFTTALYQENSRILQIIKNIDKCKGVRLSTLPWNFEPFQLCGCFRYFPVCMYTFLKSTIVLSQSDTHHFKMSKYTSWKCILIWKVLGIQVDITGWFEVIHSCLMIGVKWSPLLWREQWTLVMDGFSGSQCELWSSFDSMHRSCVSACSCCRHSPLADAGDWRIRLGIGQELPLGQAHKRYIRLWLLSGLNGLSC